VHFWYDDVAPLAMSLGAQYWEENHSLVYMAEQIRKFRGASPNNLQGSALQEISRLFEPEDLLILENLRAKYLGLKNRLKKKSKGQKSRKITSTERIYIYSLVMQDGFEKKHVAKYFGLDLRSVNRIICQLTLNPEKAIIKSETPLKKDIITEHD
jgi:hypothetical protein